MDVGAALVADGEAAEAVEPGEGSFHHPAMAPEALTGVDASPGNASLDASSAQKGAAAAMVIGFVGMELFWPAPRSSSRAADRRNCFDQRFKDRAVVAVGPRELRCQRDALPFNHKVALRARFAAIRRIRSGESAPLFAGTLALSKAARLQSIWSASPSQLSNSWWMRFHTPASCHSLSLLQQVIPLPQPISFGSNSQGIPVRSTKRMPVSACRLGIGGRPPLGRGGRGGRSSSSAAQRSSSSSAFAIRYHATTQRVLLDALSQTASKFLILRNGGWGGTMPALA